MNGVGKISKQPSQKAKANKNGSNVSKQKGGCEAARTHVEIKQILVSNVDDSFMSSPSSVSLSVQLVRALTNRRAVLR